MSREANSYFASNPTSTRRNSSGLPPRSRRPRRAKREQRADLLKAELDRDRTKTLFDRNVVAQAELDAANTTFEIARASHESARYQVEVAEAAQSEAAENLSKTSIFSPMTGTISMLNVELGERVVGTGQMAGDRNAPNRST